jgi:hypothetical protein
VKTINSRITGEEDNSGDFYLENGFKVMTANYHLARGYCCSSGCRHCPYKKEGGN